ncbi:MAG: diaminopimelate epimerase [bacterium]|nr:diaminopimelate epimerase [bacterium]
MEFTKMHGAGNDFIVVDALKDNNTERLLALPDVVMRLCDRHFGIGADGLILILPSEIGDLKMRILNPDGSEAEMCGNGIRCFAKYAFEHGLVGKSSLRVETLAGVICPELRLQEGRVVSVSVDMGKPRLTRAEIPMTGPGEDRAVAFDLSAQGSTFKATAVSMGNPHCVIFTDDPEGIQLESIGPAIENHPFFPRKTNVEFVQVLAPDRLKMLVWERGAGRTMACGTGACAALVAAVLNGLAERTARVLLPGGELEINWRSDDRLIMTGPAEEVFTGSLKA